MSTKGAEHGWLRLICLGRIPSWLGIARVAKPSLFAQSRSLKQLAEHRWDNFMGAMDGKGMKKTKAMYLHPTVSSNRSGPVKPKQKNWCRSWNLTGRPSLELGHEIRWMDAKSISHHEMKPWLKPLFVGIYRTQIPGFLRWCLRGFGPSIG